MAHPIIIGHSKGLKRPAKVMRDGTVFRARNRPPAIQLRRGGQFMEFAKEEEHTTRIEDLLVEIQEQDARHAGTGVAGHASVCKTGRAQEIFDEIWEIVNG